MYHGGRRPYGSYPRQDRGELPPISPPARASYSDAPYTTEAKRPVILPSVAEKYVDGANLRRHRLRYIPPVDDSIYDFSHMKTKLPLVRPPARGKDPDAKTSTRNARRRTLSGAVGFKSSSGTRRY